MLKKFVINLTLAECGFLSNREEAQKLTEEEYQDQVAAAVCDGVLQWLNSKEVK